MWLTNLLPTGELTPQILTVRDGLVNMYIIRTAETLACIDTGWRPASISRGLSQLGLNPENVTALFLTHLHWDHARCTGLFPNARIYVGELATAECLEKNRIDPARCRYVTDNQVIPMPGLTVRALHTPGHTEDSVSYLCNGTNLFTGDCLHLRDQKVVSFSPGMFNMNKTILESSILRLANVAGAQRLFTSHTGMSGELEFAFDQWHEGLGLNAGGQ